MRKENFYEVAADFSTQYGRHHEIKLVVLIKVQQLDILI